jgi:hypothetical protein
MIAVAAIAVLMEPARIVAIENPILLLVLLVYLALNISIVGIFFAVDRIVARNQASSKAPTITHEANSSGAAERV